MKKLLGLLVFTLFTYSAMALEPIIELDLDYASNYLWRNQDVHNPNDKDVAILDAAIQPALTIYTPLRGLTLGTWGSFPVQDAVKKDVKEVDYTVNYDATISDLTVTTGYTLYTFPSQVSANSSEVYVGLALDFFLNPSVRYYMPTGQDDSYTAFGLGYQQDLGRTFFAGVDGTVGYKLNNSHITTSAIVGAKLSDITTVKLTPTYLYALDAKQSKFAVTFGISHLLVAREE